MGRKAANAKGCPQLPDIIGMEDSCAYYLISLFILSHVKSTEMSKKRICTFRLVFRPTVAAASLRVLTFGVDAPEEHLALGSHLRSNLDRG